MKHPCLPTAGFDLEKLREFHHVHQTPIDQASSRPGNHRGGASLPYNTCSHEAEIVAERFGATDESSSRQLSAIGELLPAVLPG